MGKAFGTPAPRMQTDTKLGMAESRFLTRRKAHVAREDELAAHAAGAAPNFCDADHRGLREAHERIHQNGKARSTDSRHDVPEFPRQIEVRQVKVGNCALENNDAQALGRIHSDKKVLEGMEDVRVNNVEGWVVEYYPPVRRHFFDDPHRRCHIRFRHSYPPWIPKERDGEVIFINDL